MRSLDSQWGGSDSLLDIIGDCQGNVQKQRVGESQLSV